jgi:hypothetical protein
LLLRLAAVNVPPFSWRAFQMVAPFLSLTVRVRSVQSALFVGA